MGALNDAFDAICASIAATGLQVITDPHAARPGAVIVEPSTITVSGINGRQRLLEFPVWCLAPPPGDSRAMRALNDMADLVINKVPAVSATHGRYEINGNEMPGIQITVNWPCQ